MTHSETFLTCELSLARGIAVLNSTHLSTTRLDCYTLVPSFEPNDCEDRLLPVERRRMLLEIGYRGSKEHTQGSLICQMYLTPDKSTSISRSQLAILQGEIMRVISDLKIMRAKKEEMLEIMTGDNKNEASVRLLLIKLKADILDVETAWSAVLSESQ